MKKALFTVLVIVLALACAAGAHAQSLIRFEDGGAYTFYNEEAGGYLSWQGNTLTLSKAPAKWTLAQDAARGFHVYALDTELMLDIDNANVREGTTIKVWPYTGWDVQIWNLLRNANGTYTIAYCADNSYCLGFVNGNAVLQRRDQSNPSQEWLVEDVSATVPKPFLSYTSRGGIIQLQLPLDVHRVVSESRIQQWANELETAFYSFYDLTSYWPYDYLVVKAYETSEREGVLGWVYSDSNIIHIDRQFLYEDLERMSKRENDWNFCALHEMGHIFDNRRGWDFEAEMMTDLKVAYVLEMNGAAAAPSEFDASTVFYGADIIEAYNRLGSTFAQDYNIFGMAERMLEIKQDIGWEPFKETYRHIQAINDSYDGYSKQQRFENFISLLSRYSGRDIQSCFTQSEWNTILNKLNQ